MDQSFYASKKEFGNFRIYALQKRNQIIQRNHETLQVIWCQTDCSRNNETKVDDAVAYVLIHPPDPTPISIPFFAAPVCFSNIFSLDEKNHSNLKIKICQNNPVLHIENRKTNGGSSKLWSMKLSTTLSKYISSSVFRGPTALDNTRPCWN